MVFLSLSSRSCSSSREWSPPPQAEAPGMKCSRCQHENPSDAVFCQECGTRFEAACQSCGTPNELSAKFCKKCGQRLNGPQTSQAVPDARFGSPESYTPKHLTEKILTSKAALEGGAQASHGALRRPQRLDGAPRRPGPRGSTRDSRSGSGTHDGGRAPLRGHGEPSDGRRHHGALRRAA